MANINNINKVIDALRNDDGRHFRMGAFIIYLNENDEEGVEQKYVERYLTCKTAFCLAGTANLLRLEEEGKDPKSPTSDLVGDNFEVEFENDLAAAKWLGLTDDDEGNRQAHCLFYSVGHTIDMGAFDRLPPAQRRAAGIRVLEILRDTGEVDWDRAFIDVGIDVNAYVDWDD